MAEYGYATPASDAHVVQLPPAFRRVSLAAVVAAVVVTILLQVLFTLTGIAIGLTALDPSFDGENFWSGLTTATGIWTTASAFLSLFFGGWVAGRLAANRRSMDGALHGLVTWAVVSLLAIWLMGSSLGTLLNSTVGALGNTIEAVGEAGQTAGSAMGEVIEEAIPAERELEVATENFVEEIRLRAMIEQQTPLENVDWDDLRDRVLGAMDDIARAVVDGEGVSAAERELTTIFAEETQLTRSQIGDVLDRWSRRVETGLSDLVEAAQREAQVFETTVAAGAEEVLEDATDTVRNAAVAALAALLIGLIAAMIGGAIGSPSWRPEIAELHPESDGSPYDEAS